MADDIFDKAAKATDEKIDEIKAKQAAEKLAEEAKEKAKAEQDR